MRNILLLVLFVFLSANTAMATKAESTEKKVYFLGKETDYKLSDFKFFGESNEPFWGSASDEYEATVDQWPGLYTDSNNPTRWQRVIPDDSSIADGAPWCTLQFFEKSNDTITVTRNELTRCAGILAISAKAGVIPERMKGTLLDYEEYYVFSPQIEHIVLSGKFPEASRTDLHIRTKETRAHSFDDLKIMLNEIYARYGYVFTAGGVMDQYFRKKPWYRPQYTNVDALITETEHGNIKLIKQLLSPESKNKKELYIENTTSFCKALEDNNIRYVMDNTSEDLTTGPDNVIGHAGLKRNWEKYRSIMVNGVENCKRDIESYKRAAFLYVEPINIYYNSFFEFDEQKRKYVLSDVELEPVCNKQGDTITLSGLLIKRKNLVNGGGGKNANEDIELKTMDIRCVAGANMDQREWDRYVKLIISPEMYHDYERVVGNKVTLQGKLIVTQTMSHMTPLLLDLIGEDKPVINVSDVSDASQ